MRLPRILHPAGSSWVLIGSWVLMKSCVLIGTWVLIGSWVLIVSSVLIGFWVLIGSWVLSPVRVLGLVFLVCLEKQLKSIEFSRKKNITTIFLGIGAKKLTNSCSLLFKMLMISAKWKKALTENNEIAPGTSLESG